MSSLLPRMTLISAALLLVLPALPIQAQQPGSGESDEDDRPQVGLDELATAPAPVQPAIQAPRLGPVPSSGMGRMRLAFAGNRIWCTFPDDRVVTPPPSMQSQDPKAGRDAVYTFGYQFTVAAVERGRPAQTLLLFESPVFRTAVYRQAAKLGKGQPKPQGGPVIVEPQDDISPQKARIDPTSLIPWWQEQYRCTTLPETIDVDLDPGTYDVYMAFDILLRSGNWTHRTIGFGTDIPVETGRTTRVDARANMGAGSTRQLEILGAEFADAPAPAARP